MAYPVVALLAGMIFKIKKLRGTAGIILGMLIGWIIEYGMGTAYYSYSTTVSPVVALSVCVVPFIFGDICKSILIFTFCPSELSNAQISGKLIVPAGKLIL